MRKYIQDWLIQVITFFDRLMLLLWLQLEQFIEQQWSKHLISGVTIGPAAADPLCRGVPKFRLRDGQRTKKIQGCKIRLPKICGRKELYIEFYNILSKPPRNFGILNRIARKGISSGRGAKWAPAGDRPGPTLRHWPQFRCSILNHLIFD